MRKLLIIVAVVVVLIAVGAFLLLSNLDSLVAKAIESNGSEVTGTRVHVSGVDIALREGRGTIEGISVANPDGYHAPHAFTLDDITLDLDLKSLRDEPIVIDEIRIKAPVVYAEFAEDGSLNINELKKRVEEFTEGDGGKDEGPGEPSKRIRIMRFVFEKGHIEVDASALGLEKRTVELPEIDLSDVGGSGGTTPDGIAKAVLGPVARRSAAEVARSEVSRLIEEKLGGSITDKAKGLLKKITN